MSDFSEIFLFFKMQVSSVAFRLAMHEADSGQHSHPKPMNFCMQLLLDLRMITRIRNQKLDTHFCSKRHKFSDVSIEPPKNPQLFYSTEQAK
jgi:hypothetical protein